MVRVARARLPPRLTRLTPGMHYTYTVRAGSEVLAKGTFRAAPARAGRFTFAVVAERRT